MNDLNTQQILYKTTNLHDVMQEVDEILRLHSTVKSLQLRL